MDVDRPCLHKHCSLHTVVYGCWSSLLLYRFHWLQELSFQSSSQHMCKKALLYSTSSTTQTRSAQLDHLGRGGGDHRGSEINSSCVNVNKKYALVKLSSLTPPPVFKPTQRPCAIKFPTCLLIGRFEHMRRLKLILNIKYSGGSSDIQL